MGNFISVNQIAPETTNIQRLVPDELISATEAEASMYSADAAGTSTTTFGIVPRLSSRQLTNTDVLEIENQLDLNEKVSITYLLYDDAELALKYLMLLQNGTAVSILLEWVRTMNNLPWNLKLVEALAIVQNYKVLHKLGYTFDEINVRFLPLNASTCLEIDRTKKKLYRICEDFDNTLLHKFLRLVKSDFEDKKIDFKSFNGHFLEMYLLYWNTKNYISPTNYKNLVKIFKQMSMFDMSDYLKKISKPDVPNNYSNVDVTYLDDMSHLPLSRSLSSASSVNIQDNLRKSNSSVYPMNNDEPGLCLIINQEIFYTEPDPTLQYLLPATDRPLERREGTDVDCTHIKNTMQSFGYRIVEEANIDHINILNVIESIVKEVEAKHSSLFVYILSHGYQGHVYGNNSIPVPVTKIKNIMCQKNIKYLSGKPKILIIQACQGTECQEVIAIEDDITTDGPSLQKPTPKSADMLVFWATVPGFGAIRDKKKGTWFIQSFCDKLQLEYERLHLEDICTMVIRDVINRRWGKKAMVPIKESTLSAHLYLPKQAF